MYLGNTLYLRNKSIHLSTWCTCFGRVSVNYPGSEPVGFQFFA